jgi:hypothetical protein
MKKLTHIMLFCAVLAGCAGAGTDAEPNDTIDGAADVELGSQSEAMRIAPGLSNSCPGGGSAMCVTCSDGLCISACYGGYTCDTSSETGSGGGTIRTCEVANGSCRTSSGVDGSTGGFNFIP